MFLQNGDSITTRLNSPSGLAKMYKARNLGFSFVGTQGRLHAKRAKGQKLFTGHQKYDVATRIFIRISFIRNRMQQNPEILKI